jgi:hypothetical protein
MAHQGPPPPTQDAAAAAAAPAVTASGYPAKPPEMSDEQYAAYCQQVRPKREK